MKEAKEPSTFEYVTACVAMFLIWTQVQEFRKTDCFKAFGQVQPVCGEKTAWILWLVIAFEAAIPILTVYRYIRSKRSQN